MADDRESTHEPAAERFAVDSIEADVALVESESGRTFEIPAAWLPADAAEGRVVSLSVQRSGAESRLICTVDHQATEERRRRVRAKLDKLRSRRNR